MQTFVVFFAQLCLASLLLAGDRPNVIVIVSDDQGYGDVGFNGPCDNSTPNLFRNIWIVPKSEIQD